MKETEWHSSKFIDSGICLYIDPESYPSQGIVEKVCKDLKLELIRIDHSFLDAYNIGKNFIAAICIQGNDIKEDIKLISRIKETYKKLPIIFYSRKYSKKVEYLIRREGIHFFLSPGFSARELHLVLKALIARGRKALDHPNLECSKRNI